ncbi:helix-turn-helix transcriptional regulator [Pseudomonas sp. BW16M2]|uniref:XRE family transcriptional regulator n=1 Tax=Pseudomonas TaxID=286 RepID=UPI001648D61C|nr:helix-turn-helix transcriptional regulator [Pseudomonas sp. BW16M2]MBC3436081.1 helix-turn-helix transcriptional regulator [Pseudomonas sp. BW16M2]
MNTLAQRIKQFRKAKHLTQQALAIACGWESQSRVGNYERGIREPNLADIERMATALGVTLGDLLEGTEESSTAPSTNISFARRALEGAVPVVGYAQLGVNGYFEALDFPAGHGDGYLNIHSDDPKAYGLKVTGDSMHPRIKNGEYVLVEPSKAYFSGDEVMVRTTNGRTMIKEFIYLRDGMYRFDSVNAEHAPIHIAEDEIEHIHLVGGILKSSRFMHTTKK